MKKFFLGCSLFLFTLPAFAWNAMGHRVIAVIAWDYMTPAARHQAKQLVENMADAYPYASSWQMASVWADTLRRDDVHAFDSWHFYDAPYNPQGLNISKTIPTPNSVWAIQQSLNVLRSPQSNVYEKALFLRFLLHIVGDAHQPLHDIDRYDAEFPHGDQGGNLFMLAGNNTPQNNLHAAWDAGLGFFAENCRFSWSKSQRAICLAQKIEKNYPPEYFGGQIQDLNPQDWVNQGYQIAVKFAYQTPMNQPLSFTYIKQGQPIVEQQLALAGYRLAALLNQLYG